jgi:putative FmdB family regulatory protein
MPLYDYRCHRCAHTFEELVRSTATATAVRCPQCGRDDAIERLPAAFNVGARSARAAEPPPFCGRCGENRPPCS